MGYTTPDVYFQPEYFGLSIVGMVEWDDEPYQFDMTVVWKDQNGAIYWANDSGCSCPSPFEDVTTIEQLKTGTFYDLARHLDDVAERYDVDTWRTRPAENVSDQIAELLTRVRELSR